MRRVAIVATGMTKFTMDDSSTESVLTESARELFCANDNVDRADVDGTLVSTNDNSKYLAQILSESIGVHPKAAHTVESMCSSGTSAIISAYSYIASGLADVVLVSGADRYDSPGRVLEWDVARGQFRHPIYWASLFTQAYKRTHHITDEDLAVVPVKNHIHAVNNPDGLSKKTYCIRDVLDSRTLADGIRLLDCSRPCTGGSSVLLASEEKSRYITDRPVWIAGIGQKMTSAGFAKSKRFDILESTVIAARNAFGMSGRGPDDVDVAEVHDAFSVCEPMALEATGLASDGHGMALVRDLYETGSLRVNPRGGLLGSGHPLGATGIAQIVEVAAQIQGRAEKRQVKDAAVGMVHNMAAAATSSTVLVLEG